MCKYEKIYIQIIDTFMHICMHLLIYIVISFFVASESNKLTDTSFVSQTIHFASTLIDDVGDTKHSHLDCF
jgi:hypothetical protein